jgi:plasmid stability protein
MPEDLDIENVPEELVRLLEKRAARNKRSLEHEVLLILEAAVRLPDDENNANRTG